VRIGNFEVEPIEVHDTSITLLLTNLPRHCLRAGLQGLQVLHRIAAAIQSDWRTVESNIAPFVLRPTIVQTSVSHQLGQSDELRSVTVTIQVDVLIGVKQRVVLALNEWAIERPVAYQFEANARTLETDTVTIDLKRIQPGDYLLRLHIDGAESLLSIDTDPESRTFNWYNGPRLHIS
jgi:hypothetical protein